MKLGIISDTHNLLRPEVLAALQGVDAILHAGDICSRETLETLRSIAPVHAVRGNGDREWAEHLPVFLEVTLAGLRIGMTHKKKDLPEDLSGYDLAVVGHSHQYAEQRRGRTLILNPGSCGPRRFGQAITMAAAECSGGGIEVTKIEIAHPAPVPKRSGDLRGQIELVMRETEKGRGPQEIAEKHGIDPALAEQIARLYLTHPGVTAGGIMAKMGL